MEYFKDENILKLLSLLKEANQHITLNELATLLNTSERSIQRYKRELNRILIILEYEIVSNNQGYKLIKIKMEE
jgi:predicted DNA-binding transcriptional regulator YafY